MVEYGADRGLPKGPLASMYHNVGDKVGDYVILQILGAGGMGRVYKVENSISGRVEAMKVLLPNLQADPDLADRFLQEIRVQASLQHPNIAALYSAVRVNNQLLMLMEFLEGDTLEHKLRAGPLPVRSVLEYSKQILHALGYAHRMGVVHRDIKPANIMVSAEGTAKVMDFGIARVSERAVTRTGFTVGSLYYMSPEQIQGAVNLDGRSDLYSFGITLYECVTGTRPYIGDSDYSVMAAHLNATPTPPSELNPALPKQLSDVILMAIRKEPDARFQSADQLRSALIRIEDGLLPTPPASHPAEPAGPFTAMFAPAGGLSRPSEPKPPNTRFVKWNSTPATSRAIQQSPPSAPPPDQQTIVARPSTRIIWKDAQRPGTPNLPPATDFYFSADAKLPRVHLNIAASADPFLVGHSFPILSVPFRIGRDGCDVNFSTDAAVSRVHVVIDWAGGVFTITDASSNGAYLDGVKLEPGNAERLPFGAIIRLSASTSLTFVSDDIVELPDLTGEVVDGRYKLQKLLCRSRKAPLYLARDSKLPRSVALKILSPSFARYGGYLQQFNREAAAAASIRHAHICSVLDHGQTQLPGAGADNAAVPYVCLELMEGGSLRDRLASKSPPQLPLLANWLDDLTDALDCSHKAGVVHGGLKPGSIVFDANETVYLTDFATCTNIDAGTRRIWHGSADFLAPEQWEGNAATPATDQYALAAIVFQVIAGTTPFEKQADPEARRINFERGAPAVHETAARNGRPDVPPALSPVLRRALAVAPADRFPSMREFCLAFRTALANSATVPRTQPRVFISYRRDASAGWAMLLAKELTTRFDISVFVDTQRVDSAIRVSAKVENAIHTADVFVCLLAGTTLKSAWVREEIRLASQDRKPMVPVFQESFRIPTAVDALPDSVQDLLRFEGIPLLDRLNVHIDHTINDLAKVIRETTLRLEKS